MYTTMDGLICNAIIGLINEIQRRVLSDREILPEDPDGCKQQ